MSETVAAAELQPPVFVVVPPPPVARATAADINEMGVWLLPRMCEHWATNHHLAIAYLKSALPSNEQALVRCGSAIGMAHLEPGRMGHPCRVIVDFVLSEQGIEGADECVEVFAWMARWAKQFGASGLFRVDDFTDADRSSIRQRLGKLTKRESHNLVF
jgi:hypothetical protein